MVAGKQYSEFHLPLLHRFPSTLIDYLPKNSLVILDDGVKLGSIVNEVEEDAVKMRNEGIHSGFLPEDFPVPYLSWSELQDSMGKLLVLDLGYGNSEQNSDLSSCFYPNQRYAGQLKNFVDDLLTDAQVVKNNISSRARFPASRKSGWTIPHSSRQRSQNRSSSMAACMKAGT